MWSGGGYKNMDGSGRISDNAFVDFELNEKGIDYAQFYGKR